MRTTSCFFGMAALLVIPTAAQAILITNTTTNTVLFSDNFESAPSVSTGLAPDVDFHNPVAQIGDYAFIQNAPALVVTNSTASPDPGPYSGSNYLRVYRGPDPYNEQEFATIPNAQQETAGQNIRISMMVNSGSNAGAFNSGLYDPFGNLLGYVLAGLVNPGFVSVYNGGWQNTGVPVIPGQWQRWDIDYSVGAGAVTVTVDGNSASAALLSGGAFGSYRFWNANGAPGTVYVDSVVPEPSSIALLGLATFGLVGSRRRCR